MSVFFPPSHSAAESLEHAEPSHVFNVSLPSLFSRGSVGNSGSVKRICVAASCVGTAMLFNNDMRFGNGILGFWYVIVISVRAIV